MTKLQAETSSIRASEAADAADTAAAAAAVSDHEAKAPEEKALVAAAKELREAADALADIT